MSKLLLQVTIMAALLLGVTGCSSINARSKGKQSGLYPGVKADKEAYEKAVGITENSTAIIDLPFSLALDTALLPLDILAITSKGRIMRVAPNQPAANLMIVKAIRKAANKPIGKLNKKDLVIVKDLRLDGNRIVNLQPLAGLVNLKSLHLHNNVLVNIAPLAGFKQLDHLRLDSNRIVDVRPLAELVNLKLLSIHGNKLNDVRPLAELKQLKQLNLGNNRLADIRPLAGLNQLQWLSLSGNIALTDDQLQHLKGLKQLQKLRLVTNPTKLTKAGINKIQKALPNCVIISGGVRR